MNEEKNYKEKLMKMYVKGELPVLKRNEKFNFACVQCGVCCRNRDDILLNPFDVYRKVLRILHRKLFEAAAYENSISTGV